MRFLELTNGMSGFVGHYLNINKAHVVAVMKANKGEQKYAETTILMVEGTIYHVEEDFHKVMEMFSEETKE